MFLLEYLLTILVLSLVASFLFNPTNKIDKNDYQDLKKQNECSIVDYEISNKLA